MADYDPRSKRQMSRGVFQPVLCERALMHNINIEVWDATGNKKQVVELPADAVVNRVIAVLVDKMNLPRHSPDGQLMSYKFHHRSSGRQLLENESLLVAGVRDGDVLRLQPEITAGSFLVGSLAS
jgi:hypothetical protein